MSDTATVKKQLKIKTGAASRLWKEYNLYTKEVEQLGIKLDKFKDDGAEAWYIKNTTNMVAESEKLVVVTQGKLTEVVKDLKELMDYAHANPGDFNESEELSNAKAVLSAVNI